MNPGDRQQPPESPPAEESSQQQTSGGGPQRSSASAEEESRKAVEEFTATLLQLRESFTALANNLSNIVKTETSLAAFIVKERSRLLVIRLVLMGLAIVCFVACWVLINLTLWHAINDLTESNHWAPLALALLNGVTGLILFLTTDRFRL